MEHHHEIARIAYELYLMRDGAPGDPVSDWIMAERIYEERKLQKKTTLTVDAPALVGQTVQPRARKAAVKAAPVEKSMRKEAQKPEVKAASAKVVKIVEAPKAKKAIRKKTAGNSGE
ncbi:MAG TPA: DUF2934 domain-containing protein [Acidobacteriota bacterium]|nr:DUF2934 domain-containing protein [Acidobacteriota bacterium]